MFNFSMAEVQFLYNLSSFSMADVWLESQDDKTINLDYG